MEYFAENISAIGSRLLEHIEIVGISLIFAVIFGTGFGVLLSRHAFRSVRGILFYILGLGQTVPSLAILALAVGILGIGKVPAIIALFAYALLPIARNTYTGLQEVPAATIDAGRGMGMTRQQLLFKVELPLALPYLMAGIRTATVFAISAATLAYLIGGGGLGDFIFTGIALFKPEAMLAGAIPTALLALGSDWILGRIERQVATGKS